MSLPHFMLAARECSWERNSCSFCIHAHTHTSRAFLIPLYHHFSRSKWIFQFEKIMTWLWRKKPPSNPIIADIRATLSTYAVRTQWGKYVRQIVKGRKLNHEPSNYNRKYFRYQKTLPTTISHIVPYTFLKSTRDEIACVCYGGR